MKPFILIGSASLVAVGATLGVWEQLFFDLVSGIVEHFLTLLAATSGLLVAWIKTRGMVTRDRFESVQDKFVKSSEMAENLAKILQRAHAAGVDVIALAQEESDLDETAKLMDGMSHDILDRILRSGSTAEVIDPDYLEATLGKDKAFRAAKAARKARRWFRRK